jgi:hypothetical protein
MSEIANTSKSVKSACKEVNLANPSKTPTKPKKEVAVTEISQKCTEMSTSKKIMGTNTVATSTHSVSGVRQINMADNI